MARVPPSLGGIIGEVRDYAGSTAPAGWLLCYGQAISRTTYADLYGVIGTTYGAGDGSTTFALPDCRGRVTAGVDNMGGAAASRLTTGGSGVNGATLGAAGGAETHTLTAAQLAAHTHAASTDTAAAHTHSGIVTGTGSVNNVTNTSGGSATCGSPNTSGSTASGGAHSHTVTVSANAGDAAHNNTQPTIVFNKIIFAGV